MKNESDIIIFANGGVMKGVGKLKEIFEDYISEARMVEYQPVQIYFGMIEKNRYYKI